MTLASSPRRRWAPIATGALLAALLITGPAQAAGPSARERADALQQDRRGAERALERAQAVAEGRGVKNGRELTGALLSLATRAPALSATERKRADGLLARPTDPGDTNQPGGPYSVTAVEAWTAHYCYHWVESTDDAPSLADANSNGFPDYIEDLADSFEAVYGVENGDLGWRAPATDGTLGGCAAGGQNAGPDKTDVYVKNIGDLGLYGYASVDPGQPSNDLTRHAFLVMDDDYAEDEFPQYEGDPLPPLQVTAAHEYNHVLQYGYDVFEDKWMFESTATWMEDKVYPDINDYHQYLTPWSQRSVLPLTAPDNAKVYGSAVWNHWLDGKRGQDVIRRAWEVSLEEGEFAPAAYDRAIKEAGGDGFSPEFIDFAASTAEWGASNSGIHEGAAFPSMARATSGGQAIVLPTDGSQISGSLDHTGYVLFDVAASNAPTLELAGALPEGTAGGIALVGFANGVMTKQLGLLPQGGQTSVTLANPGQFSRVTAVIVNADPSTSGFNNQTGDWTWTRDDQQIALAVTAGTETLPPDDGPGGGGNPGTPPGGPIPGGTIPGGGGSTQPSGTLRLSAGSAPRLAKVGRSGVLPFTANVNRAGRVAATATVDKKTAKRLGLGRKAVTIGTGSASAAASGPVTVKLKLTGKAKKRLKRQRKAVKVAVKVTFTPAGGAPATSSLTLKLKP